MQTSNDPIIARTRRNRTPSDNDLKVDNTVQLIPNLKFIWLNGGNEKRTANFADFKDWCEDKYIRKLVTTFEQSGWSEASKCHYFATVKRLLKHTYLNFDVDSAERHTIEITASVCKKYLLDEYNSIVATGKGLSGLKKSLKSLGTAAFDFNILLGKLGEVKLPKGSVPSASYSESLSSNNYTDKEFKAIARALHADRRQWSKKLISEGDQVTKNTFNKIVNNAFLMMVYYTAASQSELISAVVDNEVEFQKLSGNRFTITGIKNRAGGKELSYEITPRKHCKEFLELYLPLSRKFCEQQGVKEHRLFLHLDGTPITNKRILSYINYLYKNYPELTQCKDEGLDFALNCERLKSSVKYRTREAAGYDKGIVAGRHSEGVHQKNNYSKTNKEDARKELSLGVMTLETHARNNNGDIAISISTAKQLVGIKVYEPGEYESLKANSKVEHLKNGGTCQGKDTEQKRQFKRELDKNKLLTAEDKELMSCGYIVKCFGCANFGVVDEITDIWKLLSFEVRLNESFQNHKNLAHFLNNFGEIKTQIKDLKARLNQKKLKQAIKRLEREVHPLWNDEYSIDDIFRGMNV